MRFYRYHVQVDAKFTTTKQVPRYEVPLIRASWRGAQISEPLRLPNVYETGNANLEYTRLFNEYGEHLMKQVYPGPESLEVAMERDAEDTAKIEAEDNARMAADHARQASEIKAKAIDDAAALASDAVTTNTAVQEPEDTAKRKPGRPRKA